VLSELHTDLNFIWIQGQYFSFSSATEFAYWSEFSFRSLFILFLSFGVIVML
jgi:hypothetical protein